MGGKPSKADRDELAVTLPDPRENKRGRQTPRRAKRKPRTGYATRAHDPPRPWSPSTLSPHSTNFTVSTDHSVGVASTSRHTTTTKHHVPMTDNTRQYHHHHHTNANAGYGTTAAPQQQPRPQEKDRRLMKAEKILEEIAKEYAAKRAAGLVPTKPVPARTLLWEELARNRVQAGRRGQCIYGRDTDEICGCTSYKKIRIPGQENPGGVCECCNHGASWHRLVGGTMARSSRMSRSILASSVRGSRLETASSYVPSEARSSMYDYDSDEDEDEDDDDEDIANEMAVPSNYYYDPPPPPPPPQPKPQFGLMENRLSLLSATSSIGYTPRFSSGTNSLGALLQAIQRYRDMGLDEDEIEARIHDDFPPVPRKSSITTWSDVSHQSQVDI